MRRRSISTRPCCATVRKKPPCRRCKRATISTNTLAITRTRTTSTRCSPPTSNGTGRKTHKRKRQRPKEGGLIKAEKSRGPVGRDGGQHRAVHGRQDG